MSKNILFIILVLSIGSGYWLYQKHLKPSEFVPIEAIPESVSTLNGGGRNDERSSAKKIMIQISGEVAHPGIYEIEENTRLQDALERAGGALPSADLEKVNLVAKVKDGKRYNIPERSESQSRIKKTKKASQKRESKEVKFPINVNFATEDELTQIPGIGHVSAKAIIDERMRVGHFSSLHDLLKIKGIGPATLKKIAPYVTL